MQVLAEQPWGWFLFDDDGKLYLDVLVEHGAISFNVTAELTAEQAADYARKGNACLDQLASQMRHAALMREWRAPTLPADWGRRSTAAVHAWQQHGK